MFIDAIPYAYFLARLSLNLIAIVLAPLYCLIARVATLPGGAIPKSLTPV